ncbi:MAG: GerMN domain-containing protein [Christensenellaceae bacterium]|jgi:hypothetical protein|nr:GerMN domain-containing protein [Christensenellaceae bacterium]
MKKHKHMAAALALLCALLMLSGCASMGMIEEDRVRDDLPVLDPEDGVEKDVRVVLYYRLNGEKYLVGIQRNISVRANERTEMAIIRTLLAGVPQQSLSGNVSALFPAGVEMEDATLDSGILYITLSTEFLDDSMVEAVRKAGAQLASQSEEYRAEYEAAIQRAQDEVYLSRALGVYSLVNTLTGYSPDIRVQFLVDVDGNGIGTRFPRSVLGMPPIEGAENELLEPLRFTDEVVVTPERVAECALTRMAGDELEMAYGLFMESDSGGEQRPTYSNFETEMLSLGNLRAFTITGSLAQEDAVTVYATLEYFTAAGEVRHIEDAQLLLKREGDLYKISYGSFKSLLERA